MPMPDFVLMDGQQGAEAFNFTRAYSEAKYSLDAYETFSISENTFVYMEGVITHAFPDWRDYRYGFVGLAKAVWGNILAELSMLREDLSETTPLEDIVVRYAIQRSFWNETHEFRRYALIAFLDSFAVRITAMTDRYPYIVIAGI